MQNNFRCMSPSPFRKLSFKYCKGSRLLILRHWPVRSVRQRRYSTTEMFFTISHLHLDKILRSTKYDSAEAVIDFLILILISLLQPFAKRTPAVCPFQAGNNEGRWARARCCLSASGRMIRHRAPNNLRKNLHRTQSRSACRMRLLL